MSAQLTAEETLLTLVIEVASLKAQIASQTQPQPPARPAKEPHASLPDKFDGTRSKFRGFINQISLVFEHNPSCMYKSRYMQDEAKVATVGTLLSGDALAWFNPLIEDQQKHAEILNSWPNFKSSFTSTFGELDAAVLAANNIRKLVQGNRSASAYASQFRQLASDLSWNDAALMSQYRMGLSNEIKKTCSFFPPAQRLLPC